MRFQRRGIKPFKYIGSAGIYTEADVEAIKDAYQGNHKENKDASIPSPKLKAKPKAATKAKTKKPTKKT